MRRYVRWCYVERITTKFVKDVRRQGNWLTVEFRHEHLNPLLSLRLATVRSLSELCRFARALESCYGVRVLG